MAYTIYNNNGTVLTTIAVGEVDSYSTSLTLIGKNVNNYGEYYNKNLVSQLSNFASPETDPPPQPLTGQIWYNKTIRQLCVYDETVAGNGYKVIGGATVSGTPPASVTTGTTGTVWFDTVNSQLKVWDGSSFKLVGPAASGLLGKFGIEPATIPIRDDGTKVTQKVSVIHSYGSYVGLITTSSFTMEASSSTIYFNTPGVLPIREGVTISKNLDVRGDTYIGNYLYVNSEQVRGTRKDLTAYYNITPYGTYTATMSTSSFGLTNTNQIAYNAANYAIAQSLARAFRPSYYQSGSQVSVVCAYNTETSIRQFELRSLFNQQQEPNWEPYNNYPYTHTATSTSTVGQVMWLWSASSSTNVTYPAWNEVVITNPESTVAAGSTFTLKVFGGIPWTPFSYTGAGTSATSVSFIGKLNGNGEFTTSTSITATTSTNFSYDFVFRASTNGLADHTRNLQLVVTYP